MSPAGISIILVSLIPVLGLAVCIFSLDRVEKEPAGLLLTLAVFGGILFLPVEFLSHKASVIIDSAMNEQMQFSIADAITYDSGSAQLLHQVLIAFVAVALIQELAKWLIMKIIAMHAPDYDCFFDGIVYGAFTALGFVVIESIIYAWRFGSDTLVMRALMHLPVQLLFGIVMGLLFSLAREAEAVGWYGKSKRRTSSALLLSTLLHGCYEWIHLQDPKLSGITAFTFMIGLSAICFVIVVSASAGDHYFGDTKDQNTITLKLEYKGRRRPRNTAALKMAIRSLYSIVSLIIVMTSSPLLTMSDSRFNLLKETILDLLEDLNNKNTNSTIPSETEGETTDHQTEDLDDQVDDLDHQTEDSDLQQDVRDNQAETPEEEDSEEDLQKELDNKTVAYSRYDDLSNAGQRIYETMISQLENGEETLNVDSLPAGTGDDEITQAVHAVYYDHPEYFWIDGGFQYTTYSTGEGITVEIRNGVYDYWEYTTDKKGYAARLDAAVEEIAAQAREYSTDYDQVKYVHDWLCRNVTYDRESAEEIHSTMHKSKNYAYCHSAYGCLVNRLCVCDGYSRGFQLILSKLGIPCCYIEGLGQNEPHAWNFLNIDGDYYYMDVTWDDPDSDEYKDLVMYSSYCMTYNEMLKEHSISEENSELFYPICSATDCSFFNKEGLYLTDYDLGHILQIAAKHVGQPLCLRFSSSELGQLAEKKLMQDGEINQIMEGCSGYFVDNENQDLYILPE